jgi:hypothetical protein
MSDTKDVQVVVTVQVQAGATEVAIAYSLALALRAAGIVVKAAYPYDPVGFDDEGDYA